MKILLSILLIALLLFSCSKDDEEEVEDEDTFFPLELGNEWHYNLAWSSNDSGYLKIKVESKLEINNKSYYVINYEKFYSEIEFENKHVYTEDGIHFYEEIDNEDKLFLVFKDTLVTENTVNSQKLNCYIRDNNFTIDTEIGSFNNLATIATGEVEVDAGYTEVFVLNIGMVERSWFGGSYKIKYCKVGNKEYGKK